VSLEPDDVIDLPHGRLARVGTVVEWQGWDGQIVPVGSIVDLDYMLPTLRALGLDPTPPELLEWCWTGPMLISDVH
jgi:hypothetical protein